MHPYDAFEVSILNSSRTSDDDGCARASARGGSPKRQHSPRGEQRRLPSLLGRSGERDDGDGDDELRDKCPGYESTLDELVALANMDDREAAAPSAVLLSGCAGVGKTRMVRACVLALYTFLRRECTFYVTMNFHSKNALVIPQNIRLLCGWNNIFERLPSMEKRRRGSRSDCRATWRRRIGPYSRPRFQSRTSCSNRRSRRRRRLSIATARSHFATAEAHRPPRRAEIRH